MLRRHNLRRTPRLNLAALVVAGLLAACSEAPAPVEPLRAVRTVTVEIGSAAMTHDYAAEIRARSESRLAFRVGGKLVRRMADVGDTVSAGQPLAQIDASDLQLGNDAARAALEAAQANLELSEAEFKRFKELREQGFISGMELDRREAALKSARAQVVQLRAQATVQTNQATYSLLRADVAGVVTGVDVEPGAVVSAGMTILRLARNGPRDAVYSVPEDQVDAARALIGKAGAVRLRRWNAEGQESQATVREVAAAADPATRTFLVKADVGDAPVRLGQTASVLVDSPVVEGVIKLPLGALFEHGGKSSVWLLDRLSMTVRPRSVKVGGAEGNRVVIIDGLMAGQTVVSAGVHTLTPGQKVRLYAEPTPARAVPPSASSPASAALSAEAASASR